MTRLILSLGTTLLLAAPVLATQSGCSGADDPETQSGGGGKAGGGAGGDEDGGGGAEQGGGGEGGSADTGTDFAYSPSNLDGVDLQVIGPDVVLTDCADPWIDTDAGAFACGEIVPFVTVDQGPGHPDITVFVLNSLHIEAGAQIAVRGSKAVALAVRGDVLIEGYFYVRGDDDCGDDGVPGGYAGGYGTSPQGQKGVGPGGGAGGLELSGGAGGTYGGSGGPGGASSGAAGMPGAAYGAEVIIPLVGGSGGGGVGYTDGCGGAGGGALLLASSTSIVVAQGAGINAGGRAGSWGGGGGSGGALLLEAPSVTIDGVLAVNGGGGGGSNASGCLSTTDALPACGGSGGFADGGSGSSGINPDGGSGTISSNPYALSGGGGGGAGRIRINSQSRAVIHGTISPGASTSLFSEGML